MATFKLSKDARLAFKQNLVNKISIENHERSKFEIKQEIKTERNVQVEPLHLVKQENIKKESPFTIEPDPKHDITSFASESKNEFHMNNNTIEHQSSSSNNSILSSKYKKNNSKTKYFGQRRRPLIATATQVHRYLSSKDPYSLTKKQQESLNWAESVIMGRNTRRIAEQHTPIEVIDDDRDANNNNDSIALNDAFMHNETITIPDTFQLAIVDFASPGGRYSLANARLIEQTLSKAVVTYILENPNATHPIFGKSVYFDGVLVLDCKDQVAYDFAKLILWDRKLWDGSNLKMLEPQKSPFDSIGSLHAPDVGIDKNKVLDILKAQNPSINMANWKMLGETCFKCGFKQYSIKISNPPVYFQRHKQLRLFFGGSEVILKLFGCEWLWNCKV
ncbi:uncharacterized protein LOC129945640 [Eupeodes corollae]|uniref:uncharacterized protein LOC129945640 n=1 Tax=Eupeodes corollae TaxID=290404 RepID=UPI0024921893|nr:uncharacterized protein LOC129945640 [Eupeodes corollae]